MVVVVGGGSEFTTFCQIIGSVADVLSRIVALK
jgi:hypothetical protein